MTHQRTSDPASSTRSVSAPIIPHKAPAAGTGSLEAALDHKQNPFKKVLKVAGASLGFVTLRLALFTFPLMTAVQFTCAKIGMVTGTGLAEVLRRHYPRPLLYTAVCGLFVANIVNVGADIGAIAAAINLLIPIPMVMLIVPIALSTVVLQV